MAEQIKIAAVVLAAGGSTRLGQPKQLLKLGDTPLIQYVLDTVRASSVDDRYVVLGYAADRIREQVSLDGFHEIHNPDYISGQSTSICAAVDAVADDVSAVIFVLGDQPLQVPKVIDLIAQSYRDDPAPIIQPQYSEGPGNPVLIDRSLFGELAALTGDTGARILLREKRDQIRRIDCAAWSRPADVDTWEDYNRVKSVYEAMSRPGGS
jgi:molybdenum cofactor cytidylyltransferase